MTFADKVKIARAAQHLTQQELANQCGLSLRTIQNYELGARLPKSSRIYTVLAEALDISEVKDKNDKSHNTMSERRRNMGNLL